MESGSELNAFESQGGSAFPRTQWTMVLTAAHGTDDQAKQAMQSLCEAYSEPVRNWLRRTYCSAERAKDLSQAFMEHLLVANRFGNFEKRDLKFRSFLITCLKRFVRGEWRKDQASKRGGHAEHVDVDEAAVGFTPDLDRQLDLDFAVAVHYRALRYLESREYQSKPEFFSALKRFVLRREGPSYAEIATLLRIEPNYVKKLVHDLRHHYLDAFHREVKETVAQGAQDEETRYLLELLARDPDSWELDGGPSETP